MKWPYTAKKGTRVTLHFNAEIVTRKHMSHIEPPSGVNHNFREPWPQRWSWICTWIIIWIGLLLIHVCTGLPTERRVDPLRIRARSAPGSTRRPTVGSDPGSPPLALPWTRPWICPGPAPGSALDPPLDPSPDPPLDALRNKAPTPRGIPASRPAEPNTPSEVTITSSQCWCVGGGDVTFQPWIPSAFPQRSHSEAQGQKAVHKRGAANSGFMQCAGSRGGVSEFMRQSPYSKHQQPRGFKCCRFFTAPSHSPAVLCPILTAFFSVCSAP